VFQDRGRINTEQKGGIKMGKKSYAGTCDGNPRYKCAARNCLHAGILYMLGEDDPDVACGRPREFEAPLTPLQRFLKEHEEEWLEVEGVSGAVITADKTGNDASIMILASQPGRVTLPETDLSVYVYECIT